MEAEHVFVVVARVFHFVPVLVADAVVDGFEVDAWEELLERVGALGLGAVAGEEGTGVGVLLD